MSCNFNIWSAKHTQKITVYSLKRNLLRLVMGDVKHATNATSASATGKQQQNFPGRPGSLCCSLCATTFLEHILIARSGHATQCFAHEVEEVTFLR